MELDEVLLDKLYDQKERLISWANEIDSIDLKKWAKEWACIGLNSPDLMELIGQLDKSISSQQKGIFIPLIAKPLFEFTLVAIAHNVAIQKFEAGDFEASLGQAFSAQFWLGERQGRKNQHAIEVEEKASRVHKENRALKRDAIKFFIDENLEHLSNEKAASRLADKVKISTRKLAEYISDYKKFLKICGQSDLGQSFLQRLGALYQKLNGSGDLSLSAVDLLRNEFHEHRIASFMRLHLRDKEKLEITERRIIASEDCYAKDLLGKLDLIVGTSSQ